MPVFRPAGDGIETGGVKENEFTGGKIRKKHGEAYDRSARR